MATKEQLQALQKYTACDISDALLKLNVPNCGFLPDLNLYAPPTASPSNPILIAPASTVRFAPKTTSDMESYGPQNIPPGKHWVDLTEPESIVVISQPKGQICAVAGGIMALRMKVLNAKGVVVHGRVRDVEELAATGLAVSVASPADMDRLAEHGHRSGLAGRPSRVRVPKPSLTPFKFLWTWMAPL
jgi:regulator of RNase E activity RraA